jgi:hypothetical protein
LSQQVRAARRQLSLQMQPLELDLIRVDWNEANPLDQADLGPIEGVPASSGFAMDRGEIRIDGESRMGMRLEAIKLGMFGIAARCAAKDRPGQQSLAPQSYQPLRIEVPRMQ